MAVDFSIVMTTYNQERYVEEAITSVLNQTHKNWELIIVDDCSTDRTVDKILPFLEDPRIKLILSNTNEGVNKATIKGINILKAEYFGILDGDDALAPDAIEVMLKAHKENPKAGFIYSQFMYCDENLKPVRKGYCAELPKGKTHIDVCISSHFRTYKLSYYKKTAGFDPDLVYVGDRDVSYKMEEVGETKFVDKVLYYFRVLPDSLSHRDLNARRLEDEKIKKQARTRRTKIGEGNGIVCVMPIYKRPSITKLVVNYLKRQTVPFFKIILVGSDEQDKKTAEECGVEYLHYSNESLSKKYQAGVFLAKEYNPSAVLVTDSDDFLALDYNALCVEKAKGYDVLGVRMIWVMEGKTKGIFRVTYRRRGDFFGPGKYFTKEYLDRMNWKIYDTTQPRNCDGGLWEILKQTNARTREVGGKVLSPKGSWEMLDSWKHIKATRNLKFTRESPKWIDKYFPGMKDEIYKVL